MATWPANRFPARVIDELRIDVVETAIDGQARTLRRPENLLPDPGFPFIANSNFFYLNERHTFIYLLLLSQSPEL